MSIYLNRLFIPILLFVIFLTAPSWSQTTPSYETLLKSDAHLHLLDFLQNGEYWSEKDQRFIQSSPKHQLVHGKRGARIVGVLKRMDHANVSHALISGMPFIKRWSQTDAFRSKYYLDSGSRVVVARDTDYTIGLSLTDYLASGGEKAKKGRMRLYPFIAGFDSTDMGAVDMIIKRIKEFPGLWEGIGEVMSRHDDLTNLTTGERPSGNHPALHRIADFAGKYHIPISIHHNITAISPSGSSKKALYLHEIKELFRLHRRTPFIWCHAGISRRVNVNNLPQILDSLLAKEKKHVYIDISWVVFEDYIYSPPSDTRSKGVDNRAAWADLIAKYPSNFLIGSDKVANLNGYDKEIGKFTPLYDTLSNQPNGHTLVKKLAHDNLVNLMARLRKKRGGVVLPLNYEYPAENFTIKKKHYIRKK